MANPQPYVVSYSFAGYQAASPSTPLPGQNVDIEFSNVEQSIRQVVAALADVRRADGRLQNSSVVRSSLSQELIAEFAEEAAVQAALQRAVPITGTSNTTQTITTGLLIFQTQADIGWALGTRLKATATADPTKFVEGYVVDYVGTAVEIRVDRIGGSGRTYSYWTLAVAGEPGATGNASGDMVASIYNPRGIVGDVYDRKNHTGRLFAPSDPVDPLEAATKRWVEQLVDLIIPVGTILAWPADALPTGPFDKFLWVNGAAYSRTTYARLYARLGTRHGAGNGSTTFNVPDWREVVAAGRAGMGGTSSRFLLSNFESYDVLGALFGAQAHILTAAQIPSVGFSGTTGRAGGYDRNWTGYRDYDGAQYSETTKLALAGRDATFTTNGSFGYAPDHEHSFGGATEGGGQAHNNVQPTTTTNYIIKY